MSAESIPESIIACLRKDDDTGLEQEVNCDEILKSDINHLFLHTHGRSLLNEASSRGAASCCKLLLTLDASPNIQVDHRLTSWACMLQPARRKPLLKWVCLTQAHPESEGTQQETPLHRACIAKSTRCLEELLMSHKVMNSISVSFNHFGILTSPRRRSEPTCQTPSTRQLSTLLQGSTSLTA